MFILTANETTDTETEGHNKMIRLPSRQQTTNEDHRRSTNGIKKAPRNDGHGLNQSRSFFLTARLLW